MRKTFVFLGLLLFLPLTAQIRINMGEDSPLRKLQIAEMAISNLYVLLVVRILMASILYYGVMRMLNVVILRECLQFILKKK